MIHLWYLHSFSLVVLIGVLEHPSIALDIGHKINWDDIGATDFGGLIQEDEVQIMGSGKTD